MDGVSVVAVSREHSEGHCWHLASAHFQLIPMASWHQARPGNAQRAVHVGTSRGADECQEAAACPAKLCQASLWSAAQ